ncbi:unnamed protein product [Urochloa decumbens]|uniref:F-box domain-containing protein n=1 Tax=Urochloa decumbens TaxID=240449 RepID=A0ABC8WHS0_9POAL
MVTAPAIKVKRQAAAAASSSSRGINDDVVTEILLRLPCAAVLRSRAVCKTWRRITTSTAFGADHARRQPLELILHRHRHGPSTSSALETIPLATLDEASGLRLHVQHPEHATPPKPATSGYDLALVASCDGLLLFEKGPSGRPDYSVSVCNPVTRQWAEVPRPPGTWVLSCGFYAHKPSGEHRILWLSNAQQGSHYVSSLEAAGGARRLGPAPTYVPLCVEPPLHHVTLHGVLHWLCYPGVLLPMDDGPCPEPKERGKIVAFDTLSETFRRMSRPPRRRDGGHCGELFLLEVGGMLAVADFLNGSMDLWVMEDYDDGASWRRRLRVDLPSQLRGACWAMGARVEGRRDVILLGDRGRCWVALYDVTEKRVVKQIQLGTEGWRNRRNVFVFRDSVERHAFFDLHDPQGVPVLDQRS